MVALCRYFDGDLEMVSPEQIAKLHPFLDITGVVGGMYSKTDGNIDPTSNFDFISWRYVTFATFQALQTHFFVARRITAPSSSRTALLTRLSSTRESWTECILNQDW